MRYVFVVFFVRREILKLFYSGVSRETAESAYAAYLLGINPEEGALTLAGPVLRITDGLPKNFSGIADGMTAVGELTGHTAVSADMTARALRAFSEWRRLPAGIAITVSRDGIFIYKEENNSWSESGSRLTFSNALAAVLADKEIETRYAVPLKSIRGDCEAGIFSRLEARKTSGGWLVTRGAAEHRYGENRITPPAISPLLLVYATTEAAMLWNRSAEEIRSAAAGAGHRAARLGDGERRQAGKLWLVTRDAMEKLYGSPVPEKWREFVRA